MGFCSRVFVQIDCSVTNNRTKISKMLRAIVLSVCLMAVAPSAPPLAPPAWHIAPSHYTAQQLAVLQSQRDLYLRDNVAPSVPGIAAHTAQVNEVLALQGINPGLLQHAAQIAAHEQAQRTFLANQ